MLVGCHNNAHLRTQKVLKPGEKAYSASGVLATGGETRYGRLDYTGVPGIRGEVSMLTGRKGVKRGPILDLDLVVMRKSLYLRVDLNINNTGFSVRVPQKNSEFKVN